MNKTAVKHFEDCSSFAPPGLDHFPLWTHGLRRGLHSCAVSRLAAEWNSCPFQDLRERFLRGCQARDRGGLGIQETLEGFVGKFLRELGLRRGAEKRGWPVEKIVELKTVFEIARGEDRSVGFGKACWPPLKP